MDTPVSNLPASAGEDKRRHSNMRLFWLLLAVAASSFVLTLFNFRPL